MDEAEITSTPRKQVSPDVTPAGNNSLAGASGLYGLDRNHMMALIREFFARSEPLNKDTAVTQLARTFGYRRTGARIKETLASDLRTAVRRGILYRHRSKYQLGCRTIEDYGRDELVKYLCAAIGRTWHTRNEAITATARHLGFRRTGRCIKETLKSAINAAIRRKSIERDGSQWIRKATRS